jgi:hypothetical protein
LSTLAQPLTSTAADTMHSDVLAIGFMKGSRARAL